MDTEKGKDVFVVEDKVFRRDEGRENESSPTFESSGPTDTISLHSQIAKVKSSEKVRIAQEFILKMF